MPRFLFVLSLLFFLGAGCIRVTKGPQSNAGVFMSTTGGKNWTPVNDLLSTAEKKQTIQNEISVLTVMDQNHPATIYLASEKNGVFVTKNGGQAWQHLDSLAKSVVTALVIDSQYPCTLEAAVGQYVLKSIDCGQSWQTILQSPTEVQISALTADPLIHTLLYAATTSGDVLKSDDDGKKWETILRVNAPARAIIINPADTKTIVVLVPGKSLWKSTNGGLSWEEKTQTLSAFPNALKNARLKSDPTNPLTLWLVSSYGIIESTNLGDAWRAIPLLTAPNTVRIRAFAVDPQNSARLYYATDTTLYSSGNRGELWETLPLSGKYPPHTILAHPSEANTLYYSVTNPE